MTVVVVTHPSLPFALQQERQAVALCLHSDHARMSIWRASLRHERPERPGVQSPRADVRSARACVRQSSFCEAQDFLQSRHALSHFVSASICEALTSGRTRASGVRRGQIRGMAPQPQGPCLRVSIIVGYPSGYGGFPYQRNTFAPMAVVTKTVADPSATAVSAGEIEQGARTSNREASGPRRSRTVASRWTGRRPVRWSGRGWSWRPYARSSRHGWALAVAEDPDPLPTALSVGHPELLRDSSGSRAAAAMARLRYASDGSTRARRTTAIHSPAMRTA